jgi:hypothetical protein
MKLLHAALLTACLGWAQPRQPEVFGMAGYGRLSGDEGSLGSGAAAGGTVTVPFANRWALDLDITHQRGERRFDQGFSLFGRHTHFSPAIQYRRGEETQYGFVAVGPGALFTSQGGGFQGTGGENGTGFEWHARTGFVRALTQGLLLRIDVGFHFFYVVPDVSVRAGIGWRF